MGNSLRIKINTKLYTVELNSDEPITALKEMNKFISLATEELDNYGEMELLTDLDYDQYYFVPQDVRKDKESMDFVMQQIELSEGRLHRKQVMTSKKMINLNNKQFDVQISLEELKNKMKKLVHNVDNNKIKSALFHIKGKIMPETKNIIEDQFVRTIGYAPTRTVHTDSNIQEVVMEALFFGDFGLEE